MGGNPRRFRGLWRTSGGGCGQEAKEETNLDVKLMRQFHTYSDPKRDSRHHSISTVYIGMGKGKPKAKDDAVEIGVFNEIEPT